MILAKAAVNDVKKAGLVLLLSLLVPFQVEASEGNFQVIEDKQLHAIRYIPKEPSGEALILVHGFSRNARLKVEELHAAIEFPFMHLHLVGSSHVDAENPPGYFAKSFTTETGQWLFAELLRRYVLREGFEAYLAEQEELGYIRSRKGQSQVPESSAGP